MKRIHYFAYGSNLHPWRMRQRVPSAVPLCVATLATYELRFHKRGRDGSGKCNICHRADAAERATMGVVYAFDAPQKAGLDAVEMGYRPREVTVHSERGSPLTVFTYIAEPCHIDEGLRPFTWYKTLVLNGAEAHGLPAEYVRAIAAVSAVADPDAARAWRERRPMGRWHDGDGVP